ncbi:MAG: hypothetical protein ACRD16_04865, partial [Thermoanaerobaculia bacterium]
PFLHLCLPGRREALGPRRPAPRAPMTLESREARETRRLRRVIFFGLVVAVIVGSFLVQMAHGVCPVP